MLVKGNARQHGLFEKPPDDPLKTTFATLTVLAVFQLQL